MWPDHDPEGQQPKDFFRYVLELQYQVVIDNQTPDFVISSHGQPPNANTYASKPINVGYSGESFDVIGEYDLKIGFDINAQPNYKRLPLWVLYIDWNLDSPLDTILHIRNIIKRHNLQTWYRPYFCNFTYRNPVPSRIEFFQSLSELRKIYSTGRLLNNTGVLVENKVAALQHYRFTIAWENSMSPGYVTEKLLEPLAAGSIPIYAGGSFAHTDFNSKAFIDVNKFENTQKAIEYILQVDNDPVLQQQYLQQPVWTVEPDWPNTVFDWFYSLIADKKPHLRL